MNSDIIIVSGLPRSGTSLMMQMLEKGGVPIVTDNIRAADVDNPKGYREFELAKKIEHDSSWLPDTRAKAFKMVSQLLYHLPSGERYRIIFMERDLDEMIVSQEKMLQRLGRKGAPHDDVKRAFTGHLEKLHRWLQAQSNMAILRVCYKDLLDRPAVLAEQIRSFLDRELDITKMAQAVDPSLYRNRRDEDSGST
jgi:Sulfotransferase domain